MLRRTTVLVSALVCAFLLAPVHPVFAQDPMAIMRRELDQLRAEVLRLRAEVDTLKATSATAATPEAQPPATVEMLQTQVAERARELRHTEHDARQLRERLDAVWSLTHAARPDTVPPDACPGVLEHRAGRPSRRAGRPALQRHAATRS